MSGSTPPPAARLSVVTASASSRAVIFRKGPSWQTLCIAWDRSNHTFEIGQWLVARMFAESSDLSPKGNHLVYYAGNGRRGWWTAVSHPPWLTASFFAPQLIGGRNDGGVFAPDGGLLLVDPYTDKPQQFRPAVVQDFPGVGENFYGVGLQAAKRLMRGWRHVSGEKSDVIFAKPLGRDWELRESPLYPGPQSWEWGYALFNRKSGALETKPEWTWADIWKNKLQVATTGGIRESELHSSGEVDDLILVRDFSAMTYERRPPPDWVARTAVKRHWNGIHSDS
ncbi:MAG: hypothetical protein ABI459_04975 [Deltaproteobacteria bacterium]